MKSFIKSLLPFVTGVFILLCGPLPALSELIEPTRTLKGNEKHTGHLSVFSEPPKMNVYLDGQKIGITPVVSHAVSPGKHLLHVGKVEKEFYILSGESQRYSIHKGRLIQIPVKKKQLLQTREQDEKPRVEEEKPENDSKDDEDLPPPNYFPLNPRGPIY